jgi:quercetin dioxygenase-like cupin family protein
MPNFTGNVASVDATDLLSTRFKYEAGARSFWHSHEGPLILFIEQGRGRFQVKGEKMREFGPGEAIYLPGNVLHWHGASPTEGLTWVAVAVGRKVTAVVGPVTEEEYLGKAK